MTNFKLYVLCFAPLLMSYLSSAQSLSGYILDEDNNPVPFANVLILQEDIGTNSNAEGKYSLNVDPGNYDVIVSCIGYEEKRVNVDIDENTVKNIYLRFSDLELEEAVVKAKGKDPAYAIINRAQENRKKYLKQLENFRTHIYLKATEEKIIKEKEKKKPDDVVDLEGEESDELELDDVLNPEAKGSKVSFLEIEVDYSYEFPKNSKEIRTAYQAYGDKSGFLVPQLHEANFNLYENLVSLKGISEMPFISPISSTAILNYKFKLENTLFEDGQKVYEIRITPRKKGNATINGVIWINDKLWNINRIFLELPRDVLKFHDDVTLTQHYYNHSDTTWLINYQEFNYVSKANKYKTFEGKTVIKYSDYEIDVEFPEKFFSSEKGITTEAAYERDSTYWESIRPEPLSEEEQQLVHTTDSIQAYMKSPEYLDSLQTARNKVSFLEVIWHGVDFWNFDKKQEWYINSLADFIDFTLVDGWRLGPGFRYNRRYESQRYFSASAYASVSLNTGHINGDARMRWLSNPYKRAWTIISARRGFTSINPWDAYLSQAFLVNYIKSEQIYFEHDRELVNGLYVGGSMSYRRRSPLGDLVQPFEPLEEIVTSEGLYDFEAHQAVVTEIGFRFTPKQLYMSEPKRKVILGSKYPTFYANYIHGWNGLLSSDIDYSSIEFGITQSVPLATLGYSKYNITAGTFLNTNTLFEMDKKRIRQSDPFLFSEPLRSFQFLDTSLVITKWFIEGHYLHHFNGALINNFPLIKRLKIRTVAGASAMWVQESNYRHEELLAGLERVFKIGPRRRLKLGLYGVVANSNKTPTRSGFKVAIDIIDTWKRDWSF